MSRLRRSRNKEIGDLKNPIALGSLVITSLIPVDLDQADKDFVSDEFNWLFYATENFQTLYQAYQTQLGQHLSAAQQAALTKRYRQEFLADVPRSQLSKSTAAAIAHSKQQLGEHIAETKRTLWQGVVTAHDPVGWPIPDEAERLPEAQNQALGSPKALNRLEQFEAILRKKAPFAAEMDRLQIGLKNLNVSLDQAASLAEAAQINRQIQAGIKHSRLTLLETVSDIAEGLADIYGVTLSAPSQLLELLQDEV